MTEASLLTELRYDAIAGLRHCFCYKVHDAVRKGLPDLMVVWAGFTSYVEAKYARPGESATDVIYDGKNRAQLATLCHLAMASGGRAFYAVWRRTEQHRLWSEVWVPRLEDGRPRVFLAQEREHLGAFENGLFIERLRAQHSAGWRL